LHARLEKSPELLPFVSRRFLELSGGVTRVSELLELLKEAQYEEEAPLERVSPSPSALELIEASRGPALEMLYASRGSPKDEITFTQVDIVTPNRKMLARKLTLRIRPGNSLLVTGRDPGKRRAVTRMVGGAGRLLLCAVMYD
jgi:ABC-type uncharacterized transport system fused permease/ATPase subunit